MIDDNLLINKLYNLVNDNRLRDIGILDILIKLATTDDKLVNMNYINLLSLELNDNWVYYYLNLQKKAELITCKYINYNYLFNNSLIIMDI
jgi:hypothetical protein